MRYQYCDYVVFILVATVMFVISIAFEYDIYMMNSGFNSAIRNATCTTSDVHYDQIRRVCGKQNQFCTHVAYNITYHRATQSIYETIPFGTSIPPLVECWIHPTTGHISVISIPPRQPGDMEFILPVLSMLACIGGVMVLIAKCREVPNPDDY